jgi:uncharacterized protein (TIGR02444 family)
MIYKDSNFNNVFWKFSLEFYDRPKVASRLISLQDDLGVNVNLVLCCFWSADRGFSVLTQQVISDLNAIVEDWNLLVVKPLRSVRLGIKHLESDKYKKIREKIRGKTKDLELSTEQFEQMIIYDYLNTNTGSSTLSEQDKMEIAKSNLFSYLGFLKLDTRVDSEMLDELLDSFRKFLQKSTQ